MNKILIPLLAGLLISSALPLAAQNEKLPSSLVPAAPSQAPDYFCTWNIQGYVVSYTGGGPTRAAMSESYLLGTGKYEGWLDFYPKIRRDLYFVMDDSWDIPQRVNSSDNPYLGLAELDSTRFPSFKGTAAERLKSLSDSVKARGWKGLGGWICAQEAETDPRHTDSKAYWTAKLKEAAYAGFAYWKVDWGRYSRDGKWRKALTDLAHSHAPNTYIEHALVPGCIAYSDVYRTYDIENIIAIPVTLQRVAEQLAYKAQAGYAGIINCEDEPYIAVGLGCAIGIMRHPFAGNLPDGRQDFVFPPVGRNLKMRLDEVVRAVRWHRIAQPFGVNGDARIDSALLVDNWLLHPNETYVSRPDGQDIVEKAPARISRNMPLPRVDGRHGGEQPYVLASKYPNGAVAVATIERTLGRKSLLERAVVHIDVDSLSAPIGIFGDYESLVLEYAEKIKRGKIRVLAQDLAGDSAIDITNEVKAGKHRLIIPGAVIRRVGLSAATPGDLSTPGMVLRVFER